MADEPEIAEDGGPVERPFELAPTEDLLIELSRRFETFVVGGRVPRHGTSAFTFSRWRGDALHAMGLAQRIAISANGWLDEHETVPEAEEEGA